MPAPLRNQRRLFEDISTDPATVKRARRPVRLTRTDLDAKGRERTPERTFQSELARFARDLGCLYYHEPFSKYAPAGFPDTVIVSGHLLVFAELKRDDQQPTKRQHDWLARLAQVTRIHVGWYRTSEKQALYDLLGGGQS